MSTRIFVLLQCLSNNCSLIVFFLHAAGEKVPSGGVWHQQQLELLAIKWATMPLLLAWHW